MPRRSRAASSSLATEQHQSPGDVKRGTIGDHVKPPAEGDVVVRPLLLGLHAHLWPALFVRVSARMCLPGIDKARLSEPISLRSLHCLESTAGNLSSGAAPVPPAPCRPEGCGPATLTSRPPAAGRRCRPRPSAPTVCRKPSGPARTSWWQPPTAASFSWPLTGRPPAPGAGCRRHRSQATPHPATCSPGPAVSCCSTATHLKPRPRPAAPYSPSPSRSSRR